MQSAPQSYPRLTIPTYWQDRISIADVQEGYDFLNVYNEESIEFDQEFGIIRLRDGTDAAGVSIHNARGRADGGKVGFPSVGLDELVSTGMRFFAHSHGDGAGDNRHIFSPGDRQIAANGRGIAMLSTHDGDMWVWHPDMEDMNAHKNGEGILICRGCVSH
jgi:hypothetical protein